MPEHELVAVTNEQVSDLAITKKVLTSIIEMAESKEQLVRQVGTYLDAAGGMRQEAQTPVRPQDQERRRKTGVIRKQLGSYLAAYLNKTGPSNLKQMFDNNRDCPFMPSNWDSAERKMKDTIQSQRHTFVTLENDKYVTKTWLRQHKPALVEKSEETS